MTDEPEEQTSFSIGLLFVGAAGGVLAGVALVVLSYLLLGWAIEDKNFWVMPLGSSAVLALFGYFALKSHGDRSFTRGVLIGLALSFILNAMCGAGLLFRN